jgi:hypothetical protein
VSIKLLKIKKIGEMKKAAPSNIAGRGQVWWFISIISATEEV